MTLFGPGDGRLWGKSGWWRPPVPPDGRAAAPPAPWGRQNGSGIAGDAGCAGGDAVEAGAGGAARPTGTAADGDIGRHGAVGRHRRGRLEPGRQVLGPQPVAHRAEYQMIESLRIAETHLRLGRMHVHVHLIRRQVEEEKDDRVAAGHEQAAVGFLNGVGDGAVADPAAVDEEVLHLGRAAFAGRVGDVAGQAGVALAALDGVQGAADLQAEEGADAVAAASSTAAVRGPACCCAAASGAAAAAPSPSPRYSGERGRG